MRMTRASIPNRVVIAALDRALNTLDAMLSKEGGKVRPDTKLMEFLREDREAILAARDFIANKRRTI